MVESFAYTRSWVQPPAPHTKKWDVSRKMAFKCNEAKETLRKMKTENYYPLHWFSLIGLLMTLAVLGGAKLK